MRKNKPSSEWIKKAQEDEKAGKIILKEKGPPSLACFHFQQMVEKYLKAFLVFYKKPFRKSHELGELLERCKEIDKEFGKFKENCDFLTRYYIATRYPVDLAEEISKKEARKALEKALEIKDFILKRIK